MCTQPTVDLGFPKDVHDLRLGRVLAQCPDQVTALAISDLHLAGGCPVKQLESIFEVCEEKLDLFSALAITFAFSIFAAICQLVNSDLKRSLKCLTGKEP